MNNLFLSLSLIIIVLSFGVSSCVGQSVWDTTEVKAKENTFICSKINNKDVVIDNINSIDPRETRKEYYNELVYSYISLISHDSILNAFKESFSVKKIEKLAKQKEYILIFIDVSEKGSILKFSFLFSQETTMLPEEIDKLYSNILSKVKFQIVGKKCEDTIFYHIVFKIYFNEVLNNEIHMARRSENTINYIFSKFD